MDMDSARSILEFLLRHGVDDRLLKNMIQVIPFSDSDSRLKKSIFLWKIQSEIAQGSVSEGILELLERIEELEHEEIAASEAMKRAYCAVAVECAVRCLGEGKDKEWEYFNAVKRIWKGRVSKIEMAENVGLLSDELLVWKEEIMLPVWDSNDNERVRLKSREIDAMEAVRAYVKEAWAGMDPPSLEFVPGIEGDDVNWEFLGLSKPLGEQAGEGAVCLLPSQGDSIVSNEKNVKQRGVKRKYVAVKHSGGATGYSIGETSIKEIDMQTTQNNHGPLPAPDIDEVQKATGTSPLEIQPPAVQVCVPDALKFLGRTEIPEGLETPLPDSLQLSENSKYGAARIKREQELSVETQNGVESRQPRPCVEKTVEATTANEANLDGQRPIETIGLKQNAATQDPLPDALRRCGKASSSMCRENGKNTSDLGAPSNCVIKTAAEATPGEEACRHHRHCKKQRNMPKPSLIERNSTCRTYEWDDSIDGSAEDLPTRENRPNLPSPKRTTVSPLKKYESKKVGRRRVRRWNTEEEDALRAGVEKYDVGNWKIILDSYPNIFEGRTAVDLKDKWRNMKRQSAV